MDTVPLLLGVYDVKNVAERLQNMIGWITEVNKIDEEFASWLSEIWWTNLELWHIHSDPFRAFVTLRRERYINDDITSGILALFTEHYGKSGRYLFVPHWTLEGWQGSTGGASPDWEWGRKWLTEKKVEKVFAIVHMSQHWGAFCVDFSRKWKSIIFGDSLRYSDLRRR